MIVLVFIGMVVVVGGFYGLFVYDMLFGLLIVVVVMGLFVISLLLVGVLM